MLSRPVYDLSLLINIHKIIKQSKISQSPRGTVFVAYYLPHDLAHPGVVGLRLEESLVQPLSLPPLLVQLPLQVLLGPNLQTVNLI